MLHRVKLCFDIQTPIIFVEFLTAFRRCGNRHATELARICAAIHQQAVLNLHMRGGFPCAQVLESSTPGRDVKISADTA
jgi:hypothetical protein